MVIYKADVLREDNHYEYICHIDYELGKGAGLPWVSWSFNNRHLVFAYNVVYEYKKNDEGRSYLKILDTESQGMKTIAEHNKNMMDGVAISPDNKYVVYAYGNHLIKKEIDLESW